MLQQDLKPGWLDADTQCRCPTGGPQQPHLGHFTPTSKALATSSCNKA